MFRRSLARWISLAESRALFMDSNGAVLPNPTATLLQTLCVLNEHYRYGDKALTYAALQRLLSLDVADSDSATIASFAAEPCCDSSEGGQHTEAERKGHQHLVLRLMTFHNNDVFVRERCCRCIANMCQLAYTENDERTGENCGGAGVPDCLVEQGAIELVLETLSMAKHLSSQGRVWAVLALLNLVCLSREGADRVVCANEMTLVTEVLTDIMKESSEARDNGNVTGGEANRLLNREQCAAADAALGVVARLLVSSARGSNSGACYHYEEVDYGTVKVVVRSLSWLSQVALRELQLNRAEATGVVAEDDRCQLLRSYDVGCDKNTLRQDGHVSFSSISSSQQSVILTFLPLLQKAWMSLKSITSCGNNLPMVYDVLHELLCRSSTPNSRGAVGKLAVIEVVKLLCINVKGLAVAGFHKEEQLQQDVIASVMGSFADLTATRKDLGAHALAQAAVMDDVHHGVPKGADTAAENDRVSAVHPTEAALSVIEVLSSGLVSGMALSVVVQISTDHAEKIRLEDSDNEETQVYDADTFELLIRCIQLLANLAEEDIAVSSLNTLAVLHTVLMNSTSILSDVQRLPREKLSSLFACVTTPEQMVLFHQCGIVAQVYAAVWGVLRTKEGVRVVAELGLYKCVMHIQEILESLCRICGPPSDMGDAHDTGCVRSSGPQKKSTYESVVNASAGGNSHVEGVIRRLVPLGHKVLQSLETAIGVTSTSVVKEQTVVESH
uniref:WGS project CAEQ00000000 data, annotated contig 397 n=1 Tax=Trypanosoma congolense (strain IL3000) TaxID=1068625 RepID=F9WFK6_TRYCI|nr:unnamed protein product [Trypanosoma congolense IL3000]